MRPLSAFVAVAALLTAAPAVAVADDAARPAAAASTVDYAQDASWLCRPGRQDACDTDLSVLTPSGATLRFEENARAPIDCFYVYPTVSRDPTDLSDLTPGAAEEIATAQGQVARLASVCRVFAPVYRQVTLAGLAKVMQGGRFDLEPAYADVKAAWERYLAHDNGGRGVVLIGHSQGSLHLSRLIVEEIDGKPVQARLVGAILAGHTGLGAPGEADRGGSFKTVPFCRTAAQTGCVYTWGTYPANDPAAYRVFGSAALAQGLTPACVYPARPEGGSGPIRAFVRRLPAPAAGEPLFTEASGLTGGCFKDARGAALGVEVAADSAAKPMIDATLARYTGIVGWGVHNLDLTLAQGDVIDRVKAWGDGWR